MAHEQAQPQNESTGTETCLTGEMGQYITNATMHADLASQQYYKLNHERQEKCAEKQALPSQNALLFPDASSKR